MNLPDLALWAITLAAIGASLYTFTITFLGSAISQASVEEQKRKIQRKNDLELKVNDLQNKLSQLKESGDDSGVQEKAKEISKLQKKYKRDINKIHSKYNSLNILEAIKIPSSAFIATYILSELSKGNILNTKLRLIIWFFGLGFLCLGIYRLFKSISLAYEISLNSQDKKSEMKQAFQEALVAHEAGKQEELTISFKKVEFPLTITPDAEIKIAYRISLKKGRLAHDPKVWFFVPDGFQLIDPEKEDFRQDEDYVVPNIRTIMITHNDIVKGTYTSGSILIRSPKLEGKYYILNEISCHEYSSRRSQLEIIVKA